jgi:hypothetical protein
MATRHTDVIGAIGPSIVEGVLPGDTVITLEWLCQEYAVSRTLARVLREEHWDVFDPDVLRWLLSSRMRGPAWVSR